jgi:hypothetical protein
MQSMKLKIAILVGSGALVAAGCTGGGGGGEGGSGSSSFTDIVAERGPLLGAYVTDSNGIRASDIGAGAYRFTSTPSYPISSLGGFIDVNRNGIVDTEDIKAGELKLKSGMTGAAVTLGSTLASNPALKASLIGIGFTEEQLLNKTPTQDRMIAALSDTVYKFAVENGISDVSILTMAQLGSLSATIQARVTQYNSTTTSISTLEQQLIGELGNLVQGVDSATATAAANATNTQMFISSLPVYSLTDAQKESIAFMWNEEKLAKDLYLALNAIHPSQQLSNIATYSETQHQSAMQSLLAKYNIDVWQPIIGTASYSSSAMERIQPGAFTLPSLQTLYDGLLVKGSASSQASLQVGCMVEVTDVNDLNLKLLLADNVQDLKSTLESLRSGSYNHYWAFDSGLKQLGIADGCCSVGAEYCHPEYPSNPKQANGGNDPWNGTGNRNRNF